LQIQDQSEFLEMVFSGLVYLRFVPFFFSFPWKINALLSEVKTVCNSGGGEGGARRLLITTTDSGKLKNELFDI